MIRVVTLDSRNEYGLATTGLHNHATQLQDAEIDILCCQGLWRSKDGSADETRILADVLRMPYSCFIANQHRQSRMGAKADGVSGLAILAGVGMWMLNSGCFHVIGESDKVKGVVQFALVRKNDTTLLVLNLHLCGSAPSQLQQLHALFSHSILRERYGAVVLCGDRHIKLSAKKLQQTVTGKANTSPQRHLASSTVSPGTGILCMLTAKEQPVASVTLCGTGQARNSDQPTFPNRQASLSLDFELDRIPQGRNSKPCLPMSFEENWSGYKSKASACAA